MLDLHLLCEAVCSDFTCCLQQGKEAVFQAEEGIVIFGSTSVQFVSATFIV